MRIRIGRGATVRFADITHCIKLISEDVTLFCAPHGLLLYGCSADGTARVIFQFLSDYFEEYDPLATGTSLYDEPPLDSSIPIVQHNEPISCSAKGLAKELAILRSGKPNDLNPYSVEICTSHDNTQLEVRFDGDGTKSVWACKLNDDAEDPSIYMPPPWSGRAVCAARGECWLRTFPKNTNISTISIIPGVQGNPLDAQLSLEIRDGKGKKILTGFASENRFAHTDPVFEQIDWQRQAPLRSTLNHSTLRPFMDLSKDRLVLISSRGGNEPLFVSLGHGAEQELERLRRWRLEHNYHRHRQAVPPQRLLEDLDELIRVQIGGAHSQSAVREAAWTGLLRVNAQDRVGSYVWTDVEDTPTAGTDTGRSRRRSSQPRSSFPPTIGRMESSPPVMRNSGPIAPTLKAQMVETPLQAQGVGQASVHLSPSRVGGGIDSVTSEGVAPKKRKLRNDFMMSPEGNEGLDPDRASSSTSGMRQWNSSEVPLHKSRCSDSTKSGMTAADLDRVPAPSKIPEMSRMNDEFPSSRAARDSIGEQLDEMLGPRTGPREVLEEFLGPSEPVKDQTSDVMSRAAPNRDQRARHIWNSAQAAETRVSAGALNGTEASRSATTLTTPFTGTLRSRKRKAAEQPTNKDGDAQE